MKGSLSRLKDKAKLKAKTSLGCSSQSLSPSPSMSRGGGGGRGRGGVTAEASKIANDPSFAVEFAVGDPFPELAPQDPGDGSHVRLTGAYFGGNKRFLLKKAHFSHEDRRIFDVESGHVVLVSHHEGKNPYEEIDPLGFNESATGEWKSKTTVTSMDGLYPSFKIRPKTFSRHGTQYVDLIGDDEDEVLSVGKMGKTRSMSMRPHFVVGRGKEKGKGEAMVYKIVGDMMGRTLSFENSRGEVVAVMAKTTKAMLKTAVFGSGSESTIDVAPGMDCSTILALVFAVGQVGAHYVKDLLFNYVQDPIEDAAVESALGAATGGAVGDAGALGELADDVGLGDEIDAVGEGAANAVADFVEGTDVDDYAADVAEGAAGDVVGFFADLFGSNH